METCGQIVCSVGRLPIRFTVGTGGTIMLVRSCGRRGIADGDLRSDRVHGRETTHPFHGGHRRHNQEAIKGGDDDEAKPGINCPLDDGV